MPNSSSIATSQTSQRLLRYSSVLPKCSLQVSLASCYVMIGVGLNTINYCIKKSSAYAKCIVSNTDNLKKDNCLKEFTEFKHCIKNVSNSN